MYNPGQEVMYTPTNPMQQWAAGKRIVLREVFGLIQLKCGNIVLMARPDELTKL